MCSVSFPLYGSEDRARTVVVDIIEGHTLVTQDPSIKGVPPSPRCDSVGSLPVSPPCPTPEHSAVDICERYTDTGRAPALQHDRRHCAQHSAGKRHLHSGHHALARGQRRRQPSRLWRLRSHVPFRFSKRPIKSQKALGDLGAPL